MDLQTILTDLKEKKRALEAAIAALESLQKKYGFRGARAGMRKKGLSAERGKSRPRAESWAKVTMGSRAGQVISFPGTRSRVRLERDSRR